MATTVVEFDPLADPIRAAAENHHFFAIGRLGFILGFIGGIQIGSE